MSSELQDAARARQLFDWVIKHIRGFAFMVVILWVVMAVMCFGIITNAQNATDAAKRTQAILEQNANETKIRSERSIEDRARLELLVRTLAEIEECVSKVLLKPIDARTVKDIESCFPPVPPPPPGFLPETPKN